MSHYFGDFSIGQIFLSPKPRLITEDLIGQFGEVSGDLNPLHFDESFAKASPFGKKIAHGLLGLSVASGLLHSTGIVRESIVAFTGGDWKFKKPIFIGDSVSLKMEVSKLKKIGASQGFVILKAELFNQREELVQGGTWSFLVRVAPASV